MSKKPTKLLWLDLEMTGLRPAIDRITEIAAIVTDFDLREIASYEAGIKHPEKLLRKLMGESDWYAVRPTHSENIIQASLKGKSEKVVQIELLAFIEKHIGLSKPPESFPFTPGSLEARGEIYLAGNTIAADRAFIDSWWPDIARVLHYRMLDVSSFKIWYEAKNHPKYAKQNKHRALDDIRESIAEMKSYAQKT